MSHKDFPMQLVSATLKHCWREAAAVALHHLIQPAAALAACKDGIIKHEVRDLE